MNIHDVYQRVLGYDTNERTFKSLGLNGSLVSDTVGQLNRLFPEIKTSNDPKHLVDYAKQWLSLGDKKLEEIKEKNRSFILSNHCYTNRVEQLMELVAPPTWAIGMTEEKAKMFGDSAVEELTTMGLIRTESGTTFNDLQ